MKTKIKLALLSVCVSLPACSYLRSNTERVTTINPTNNVVTVTERTSARGYTLFDANASLVKFRNSSGYGTNGVWAPGTYATGVNETSNTTNLVNIIGAVAQGVVQGMK